jgi:trigger factor
MPFEVEEKSELSRVARVQVPGEEYQKQINRELRSLSEKVKLKGFRTGKIPMNVMRQRYGAAVTRDVIEALVEKNVNAVLEGNPGVLFLGTPTITEIPTDKGGQLEFTIDFEMRPNIDPIGYLGLEVEKPEVVIANEAIDEALEQLRNRSAKLETVTHRDTIHVGDIVTVDFQAIGDHPELEMVKGENAQIEVGTGQALPGIDAALTGAAFGSILEPSVVMDESFPIEELRGQEVPVRLTVKSVQKRIIPEVDDAFAKSFGNAETVLELRANIRKSLAEQREHDAMHMAEENMMKRLLEQNTFELPPLFLDEQLNQAARQRAQMLQQQGLDLAQLGVDPTVFKDELRDEVVEQIKSELLLIAIAEKESLKVEQEDLHAYFEHRARHMGVAPRELIAYTAQDQNRMRQASAMALLEKTRTFLLKEATVKSVAWPSADADQDAAAEEAAEDTSKKKAPAKKTSTRKAVKQKEEAGTQSPEEAPAAEEAAEDKPAKKAAAKKTTTKKKSSKNEESSENEES